MLHFIFGLEPLSLCLSSQLCFFLSKHQFIPVEQMSKMGVQEMTMSTIK